MTRLITIRVWFAALAVLALPAANVRAAELVRNGLLCKEPVYEFGEIANDQPVKHTFILDNSGTNPVRILNVRAGCGCATTEISTNPVPAGQSASLTATLTLAGRKGVQRKTLFVETDNSSTPRVRLEFKGVTTADIEALPDGVHLGTLGREGIEEREIMVAGRSNVVFHITGVETSSPLFAASFEPVTDGHIYRVKIRSQGPRTPGTHTDIVRVLTDHASIREIPVVVTAFVSGEVVAAPAALVLVPSLTNALRVQYLGVYSPSGKAFKLNPVETPWPGIETSVTNISPNRYRIEVRTRGALAGLEGKTIRLQTDMKEAPEILVPLRVIPGPASPPVHP